MVYDIAFSPYSRRSESSVAACKQAQAQSRRLARRSIYLHRTRIQDLPSDILLDLYQVLSAIDRPNPHDVGWIRMTHVDTLWRRVGLDLPILWANDYGSMASHDAVQTFRTRARNIPLTVCIPERLSKQHENVLIYAISASIRDIEALSLKTYSYLWSSLVAGKTLPKLRILDLDDSKLHVGGAVDAAPSDYLEMDFPLKAPLLTHVSLRGCRLFPLFAPSLLSLTLADQRTTSARVLDVLRGTPSLEHLVLDMSIFNIYARDQVEHRAAVQLPRLRTLQILPASGPSATGTIPSMSHRLKRALVQRIITPEDTEKDVVDDSFAPVEPALPEVPQFAGTLDAQQVAALPPGPAPVVAPALPNPASAIAQPLGFQIEPPSYEFVMTHDDAVPPAAIAPVAVVPDAADAPGMGVTDAAAPPSTEPPAYSFSP
ncbi:unnamed protein product [Peniophora sp. CBMAI 1063]|nr:unnamed protein product [Peniophora sp. CBMAI 1063]